MSGDTPLVLLYSRIVLSRNLSRALKRTVNGAATESAARHSGAHDPIDRRRDLYKQVQLGTTDLVVVAQ
jgi:hypothetical protein